MENVATKNLTTGGKRVLLKENAPGATVGTANMGYPGSENIYNADPANVFRPQTLALVRRSFPDLIAQKLTAVQPMKLPYGVAFATRMVYAGTDIEVGFENTPQFQHQSGTVKVLYTYDNAGTKGNGVFNGIDATTGRKIDIYDATGRVDDAKLQAALVVFDPAIGAVGNLDSVTVTSQGAPLSHTEGLVMKDGRFGAGLPGNATGFYPDIEFKMAQRPIKALNRKMGASYSIESAQDIAAMHSLNIEKEMITALNYELNAQMDREIIAVARFVAEDTSPNVGGAVLTTVNLNITGTGGHAGMLGRWNGEIYMSVVAAIVAQANVLALTTGKNMGNIAIVSHDVAAALQGAGHQFVQYKSAVNPNAATAFIGKLNGTIDVYRDRFARESYALVAYKGSGVSDAGIVYSPYITSITNRATNPGDFSTVVGIMSRYAITHTLLGAGRYYRLLRFVGINGIVPNALPFNLPGTGVQGQY